MQPEEILSLLNNPTPGIPALIEDAAAEALAQTTDRTRALAWGAVDTVILLHMHQFDHCNGRPLGPEHAPKLAKQLGISEEDAGATLSAWRTIQEVEKRAVATALEEIAAERRAARIESAKAGFLPA